MSKLPLIAYYIGILIIVVTHIFIIAQRGMDRSMSVGHAELNLAAAALIAYHFMSTTKNFY